MVVKSEKGLALTELAIVLPVLVVLLIGCVDLSRIFLDYFKLARVGYESVRFAASSAELATNSNIGGCNGYEGFGDLGGCPVNELPLGQARVFERINKVAARYNLDLTKLERNISRPPVGPNQASTVTITLRLNQRDVIFSSFFRGVLDTMNIRVTGPYLFPNNR